MKKRLEAELISIAHRILKLKNKSEVDQLYKETQKLYETLTVLKFYQENFESVKEDVEVSVLEDKLEQHLQNETAQELTQDPPQGEEPVVEIQEEPQAPVPTEEEAEVITEEEIEETENLNDSEQAEQTIVSEEKEEKAEPALEEEAEEDRIVIKNEPEEIAEQPVITPIFELADDDEMEPAEIASEAKPESKQVALEHLLGEGYVDPVFVKPNEVSLFSSEEKEEETEESKEQAPEKPAVSLNSAFSKSIEIGLNDRVAFVNNLFGGSNEDFNRVLSQLNTFDTFEEAKTFLNEMVIPDYNYWVGKEDYIERFMEVVEKKFA